MRVLITGASGLVGRAVADRLRREGHEVLPLKFGGGSPGPEEWTWDPATRFVDPRIREGVEAVVHLAGENIASGRWTAARKGRIRDSRVEGTRLLAKTLADLPVPPRVVVSASATGYYGRRREVPVAEEDEPGAGFLASLCREWEAAWLPVEIKGVRVVRLRLGMVLAASGGALGRMLPLFRWRLGGVVGSGQQYWSWIHLEDLARIIGRALADDQWRGPVNAVAPGVVTNAEFTQALARVLHRPAWLTVPGFVLRLALGEMADALLLSSVRVVPQRLEDWGFRFQHPALEEALTDLLVRPRPRRGAATGAA